LEVELSGICEAHELAAEDGSGKEQGLHGKFVDECAVRLRFERGSPSFDRLYGFEYMLLVTDA
jgi:hypothetical protein